MATTADQANSLGPFDAVVHNAGVYVDRERVETPDGHAQVLAVNVLAPYLLTALTERPCRLVYLSSGMHRDGDASLRHQRNHRQPVSAQLRRRPARQQTPSGGS